MDAGLPLTRECGDEYLTSETPSESRGKDSFIPCEQNMRIKISVTDTRHNVQTIRLPAARTRTRTPHQPPGQITAVNNESNELWTEPATVLSAPSVFLG